MHVIRDRERKHLHRGKKGRHGRPINKTAFLCLELGRVMQTNQWWLASTPRSDKGG